MTETGEAQKLTLSWDGKKSKGKVALTVVAKGKRGFEQRVSLGTYTYNSAYDEGFVPDGCNKCKDSYTSCKRMKAGYNPDNQWKKDKRIKGELCARLGRECVESCEMEHVLSVTFDDGMLTVQDYTNCFGYRKMTCPEKPKVVKTIRIAPKGSTLGRAKKKSRKKVDCYQKYCRCCIQTWELRSAGRCNKTKFTRCMNRQGHPGIHNCGCG
ncbi:MAG TPA: hypothetical protein EYN66_21055 [Myxococcales bacterium]|nr:hypothetical protein [Myxococcales bacterium]